MFLEEIIEELTKRVEELEAKQPIREEWLTIQELADRLQVGQTTLYRKVKSGEIYASTKTGRVRIPITQFYEEHPAAAPEPKTRRRQREKLPEDPRMAAVYEYVHGGKA